MNSPPATTLEKTCLDGVDLAVRRLAAKADAPLLIWAHGWGQTHAAMLPMAETMRAIAPSVLVDFPGFGASSLPPAPWGTADYADFAMTWLDTLPKVRRIWIGHSFGCRVGLQVAARHPGAVDALFLIAAAGLPRQRSLARRLRDSGRSTTFRVLRSLTPEGPARERLRQRFGSADYRNAGPLRPTFIKVVSENLTEVARRVRCPVTLVYGENDQDTPPDIGQRFAALIPGAKLSILRGLDHHSVLGDGQHQVLNRLNTFLDELA
jgi:pimeloyl-ACP methyl ester carboxylesterase